MLLMKEKKLFPRDLLPKLEKWIDRREAFAIKGPRQSGKTTLLRTWRKSWPTRETWSS